MACVTCGEALDNSFKAVVQRKKQKYEKTGEAYYVFEIDNVWQICKAIYFETIRTTKNVGEYYHISEFKIN